jgi:hypothetical protein
MALRCFFLLASLPLKDLVAVSLFYSLYARQSMGPSWVFGSSSSYFLLLTLPERPVLGSVQEYKLHSHGAILITSTCVGDLR